MTVKTACEHLFFKGLPHNIILCWNHAQSDHPGGPDTTTFSEGDGPLCVFVFRQVSAHMHEYAPSSYAYWSPLHPASSSISFFFFFLPFLCLCVSDSFTVVILFPAWRRTLHISCHANSATWVAVKWSMWMQTQVLTKEHTMDRQSLSTCCHLLKKSYRSICLFGLRKTTQTSFYLDALQLKSHPSIILTRRSWLVLPSPRWGAGSVLIPSPQQQSSFWC